VYALVGLSRSRLEALFKTNFDKLKFSQTQYKARGSREPPETRVLSTVLGRILIYRNWSIECELITHVSKVTDQART